MKKSTLMSLVSYLNGETVTNLDEIKSELEAELNRNAEKAAANRELYDAAEAVTLAGLKRAGTNITVGELYDEIADELPDGFTRGKLNYALTRMWSDKVLVTSGKPNTYSLK